jgi:hypothetical protein
MGGKKCHATRGLIANVMIFPKSTVPLNFGSFVFSEEGFLEGNASRLVIID